MERNNLEKKERTTNTMRSEEIRRFITKKK